MNGIRNEAEVLARCIELGALSVADAVAWADARIARADRPDPSVCDVAMSGRKYDPDVVALLRAIPGDFDESEVRRLTALSLAEQMLQDRKSADRVARAAYTLAIEGRIDDPRLLRIALWAWDQLDLADMGVVEQTRDQVIDKLQKALSGSDRESFELALVPDLQTWTDGAPRSNGPSVDENRNSMTDFDSLPLHDAVLRRMSFEWKERVFFAEVTVFDSSKTAIDAVLNWTGVRSVKLSSEAPWGPSVFINGQRKTGPFAFELDLQSGDVLQIEAETFAFTRQDSAP